MFIESIFLLLQMHSGKCLMVVIEWVSSFVCWHAYSALTKHKLDTRYWSSRMAPPELQKWFSVLMGESLNTGFLNIIFFKVGIRGASEKKIINAFLILFQFMYKSSLTHKRSGISVSATQKLLCCIKGSLGCC
jgi:hypothetical protein